MVRSTWAAKGDASNQQTSFSTDFSPSETHLVVESTGSDTSYDGDDCVSKYETLIPANCSPFPSAEDLELSEEGRDGL